VTISVSAAFASHLEHFGGQILKLTFAATLAALCFDYFAKRRENVR